jgi:protein-S-isoprenylcysteine O-methyltransferase Ste14
MISRYEDMVGKAVLTAIFAYLAVIQARWIVAIVEQHEALDLWPFLLAGRIAGMAFLCLVAFLTIMRHNPKNVQGGLEPRITSIAGTFCLMLLVVLPAGEPGPAIRIVADLLLTIGTILSIWCAIYLGRSFSVMAAARKLVVHGPYAHVRHPLYAAESLAMLGSVMSGWSIWSALLGVAWCALQFRRIHHEEQILRATFPEYEEYVQNVAMIVPSPVPFQPTWQQPHPSH